MEKNGTSFLAFFYFYFFFFLVEIQSEAQFVVGGGVQVGVGVGIGNGGGGGGGNGGTGVWIGSGGSPPGSSGSEMTTAYAALQAWKSAITGDPHGVLKSWIGSNVCSYKGIFCADSQDGISGGTPNLVVVGIDLNRENLQGTLVKELALLSDLSIIHLNSNRFSGTVPYTFGDLSSLQELDLSNNHFSGPFPSVTLLIPNLIYLDLRFNSFSGPIPEDIFNKQLDAIFLNNNQFQGQIPGNLANSPASVINLANNKLNGNIPLSFGFVGSRLKEILFLNNSLTGCVPEGVGSWSDVQVFDVSFNGLMGHLPNSISCLDDIEVLNLAHNKLSGELPDLVCSLTRLLNLNVAYNFFSGFSEECSKLFFRNVGFDFSANCIPDTNSQRPQPECSGIPGGGLSCLRIPALQPLVCASIGAAMPKAQRISSSP